MKHIVLAPLAGVSDIPFRRICSEHGATLTYVEMLSATAITYNNKKTFEMRARHSSEKILGVQVTGPTVDQVERAVRILDAEGFETVDINMGCPVRKVVASGSGSGFLTDPKRISDTLAAARSATAKPLSVKYRLGWTRENVTVEDTSLRAVLANVDMCTIHGRTRSEGYNVPVDIAGISRGVSVIKSRNPKIIALGNGNIFSRGAAHKMLAQTRCDGVMVSRGALGNPWVFEDIAGKRAQSPSLVEWMETVFRHIDFQEEHYGDTFLAARLMRKHLLWYATGFPSTRALRSELNTVESLLAARKLISNWAANLPKDLIRICEGAEHSFLENADPKFEMDRELDRGVGHLDLPIDS